MHTTEDTTARRVLVLEPNSALRSAILTVLAAERYLAVPCGSLEQVLAHAAGEVDTVALVAWQNLDGLLSDEHRHDLIEIARRLRLVVMVPRGWARLLETTDVATILAGLVAKPFEAEELLGAIRNALAAAVDA
jgi:DNA-binding response OmpR family regulator